MIQKRWMMAFLALVFVVGVGRNRDEIDSEVRVV